MLRKRYNHVVTATSLGGLALLLGGCSSGVNRLETGYRYQSLNDTEFDRMAYYVDPFSTEARVAEAAARSNDQVGPQTPGGRP
ncbi:MAG: hypothetical protein AAGI46_11670 [Planctomycetota bacterium]